MNAGSRTSVTRPPFIAAKLTQTRIPTGRSPAPATCRCPRRALSLPPVPSAMMVPTERSIPAVRITSVWPIASTPTTMTCWSTSDRFWASRKRSDLSEKKWYRQHEGDEWADGRRREHAQRELQHARPPVGAVGGCGVGRGHRMSRKWSGDPKALTGAGCYWGPGGRSPGRRQEGADYPQQLARP